MMTRLLPVLGIACIVAVITGGCGGSGGEVLPAAPYFPLEQTNWWRYNVTDYEIDTSGALAEMRSHRPLFGLIVNSPLTVKTAQDGPATGVLTFSISASLQIAGAQWFEGVEVMAGLDTTTRYYRHDAEGLAVRETTAQDDTPYYRIRQPIAEGTTWTLPFDETYELKIVGVKETLAVEAGSFNDCLQIEETTTWEGDDYKIVNWFASGTGLILTQDYFNGNLAGEAELANYGLAVQ
jgi:hypothetical protein